MKVRYGSLIATVRLIGMDTPETKDPRKPVQCFGPQASAQARHLLTGRSVWLAGDPTQSTFDKYGRELAYLWMPDGTLYNWWMIRGGYAHEYTYNAPYEYRAAFAAAQAAARAEHRGFWSPSTCNGNTTKTGAAVLPRAVPRAQPAGITLPAAALVSAGLPAIGGRDPPAG